MKSEVWSWGQVECYMARGQSCCVTLGQGLSLSGSQFSNREDQNLHSEFSKCPMCPASCGDVSLAGRAPTNAVSLSFLLFPAMGSEK